MLCHGRLLRHAFFLLAVGVLGGIRAPLALAAAELKTVAASALPRPADDRLRQELARHRGEPVLINFWASWCSPCRDELPALQRLSERWAGRGLRVVTVAVADRRKEVEDLFWEMSVDLPVIHDHEQTISRAHGAFALPATLLLDRRHRVRLRGLGVIDWDSPATDRKLQTLFH
jgi:thiol-disulfide isomerase/thioredoxin